MESKIKRKMDIKWFDIGYLKKKNENKGEWNRRCLLVLYIKYFVSLSYELCPEDLYRMNYNDITGGIL